MSLLEANMSFRIHVAHLGSKIPTQRRTQPGTPDIDLLSVNLPGAFLCSEIIIIVPPFPQFALPRVLPHAPSHPRASDWILPRTNNVHRHHPGRALHAFSADLPDGMS